MNKKIISILLLLITFSLVSSVNSQRARSAGETNIKISEIQIAGETATDEFIELYNTSNEDIDITGWRLTRKTSSGTESNLVASFSDTTIVPAYGFFLITHANYAGSATADTLYTATTNSISANNSILLYADAGNILIDKVGMDTAIDFETATTTSPSTGYSIERKAFTSSSVESMSPGGLDIFEGNSEDTDNNASDFIEVMSHPQNSSSTIEMPGNADQTVSVFLDGSFEIPEVTTPASGEATVALNTTDNTYRFALSFSELSTTQSGAHIHGFADDASNAPALYDIGIGEPKYGTWNYDESQEINILESLTYINIHTENYPDGEIRGQVEFSEPSPTPEPTDEPSPTPEPTDEPSPTPEPTQEPTPEPTPSHIFSINNISCHRTYLNFYIFGRHIKFPHLVCR